THYGPSNQNLATANPLRFRSLDSANPSRQRAAVVANNGNNYGSSPDYYRFTLDAGQTASILVGSNSGGSSVLKLYRVSGTNLVELARGHSAVSAQKTYGIPHLWARPTATDYVVVMDTY